MPLAWYRRYRHLRRYRQIGEVLLRHGFGYVLQQIGFKSWISPLKRLKAFSHQPDPTLSLGTRLRLVLEQLGPTFIKFGQLLSTRPDIVPLSILKELESLQDNVAPVGFSQIQKQVEQALGKPIEAIFRHFSPEPLAAASIGQVHRAVLLDGTEVVVKVRRPHVEQVIATDLEIMYRLAHAFADRFADQVIDIVELVDQFAKMIRRELDYTREARNIERFHHNFSDDPNVVIPKVYWQYTTDKVLTMNYIRGIKLRDLAIIQEQNIDTAQLARIAVNAFVKQVFEYGFFHGDPHPGNLLVTDDGRLVFLDFGIVGRIDSETMNLLGQLLVAVMRRDVEGIMQTFAALGALTEKPSREMYIDLKELVDDYYGKTLRDLNIGRIAEDFLEFARSYPIKLPTDLTLLVKALVTIEGVGSQLVPEFNVVEAMEPYAKKWAKEHYNLRRLAEAGWDSTKEWVKTWVKLPGQLEEALDTLNRGDLEIQFKHMGLERLINRLDVISNRLTAGIIIGALLVSSSLVMVIDRGPRIMNFPVVGLFGFLLAGMIGFWLLISIIRSGKY